MNRSIARAITRRSGGARASTEDQADGGGGLFCCWASCFETSASISFWRFCRTRLTMISPKTHGQMSATTSPTRAASAQLGCDGVPRPVIQYTEKERQHPDDDPGDPPNHAVIPPSLGQPAPCGAAPAAEPRRHRARRVNSPAA